MSIYMTTRTNSTAKILTLQSHQPIAKKSICTIKFLMMLIINEKTFSLYVITTLNIMWRCLQESMTIKVSVLEDDLDLARQDQHLLICDTIAHTLEHLHDDLFARTERGRGLVPYLLSATINSRSERQNAIIMTDTSQLSTPMSINTSDQLSIRWTKVIISQLSGMKCP